MMSLDKFIEQTGLSPSTFAGASTFSERRSRASMNAPLLANLLSHQFDPESDWQRLFTFLLPGLGSF
jgi:hypothetical protein